MNSRTLKELLPKANFSEDMLKLLEERPVFGGFIQTEMKAYMGEHTDFDAVPRAGIAPGEHVPLSPRKYLAALLMILHKAPLSLDDIGEVVDAKRGLIKKWRTEDKFREAVDAAIVKYCDRIIEQVGLIWGKLPATIKVLSDEGYSDSQIVTVISGVLDEVGALPPNIQDTFLNRFFKQRQRQYRELTEDPKLNEIEKAERVNSFSVMSRAVLRQMIEHFENDPETQLKLINVDMRERMQEADYMRKLHNYITWTLERWELDEETKQITADTERMLDKAISSTLNPSYFKSE